MVYEFAGRGRGVRREETRRFGKNQQTVKIFQPLDCNFFCPMFSAFIDLVFLLISFSRSVDFQRPKDMVRNCLEISGLNRILCRLKTIEKVFLSK